MKLRCNRWPVLLTLAACGALLVLSGCADPGEGTLPSTQQSTGGGGGGGGGTTWTTMTASGGAFVSCQGCHFNPAASAPKGLSFSPDQYTNVTNLTFTSADCGGTLRMVDPRNKTGSVVYLVLTTGNACTSTPNPMPGAAASQADVGAWIDAGAFQ